MKRIETALEKFIFFSRWLQAPLYAGLIFAGVLYAYKFAIELWHLIVTVNQVTEEIVMLGVLTLVDITMVANLLIMVIIGGYATFVSKLHLDSHEDRPDWLKKIDAGSIKVKLAGSLIGVSGIHLLKSFIDVHNKNPEHMKWQIIIHMTFLVSTLALAYTEKLMHEKHSHD